MEWCAKWHSRRTGAQFYVLPRGNHNEPPDGFIASKLTTRWVEVVSATMGNTWDRYSYEVGDGLPGKLPNGMIDLDDVSTRRQDELQNALKGASGNPHNVFARETIARIKNKLCKTSYQPLFDKYGYGLLVVNAFYAHFSPHALLYLKREAISNSVTFEGTLFTDGVILMNPYHTNIQIGLRTIVSRCKSPVRSG